MPATSNSIPCSSSNAALTSDPCTTMHHPGSSQPPRHASLTPTSALLDGTASHLRYAGARSGDTGRPCSEGYMGTGTMAAADGPPGSRGDCSKLNDGLLAHCAGSGAGSGTEPDGGLPLSLRTVFGAGIAQVAWSVKVHHPRVAAHCTYHVYCCLLAQEGVAGLVSQQTGPAAGCWDPTTLHPRCRSPASACRCSASSLTSSSA